ncbi:MAG: pyridoxal phosphate-dependent aminotransferase [Planctomycetota bacterium]
MSLSTIPYIRWAKMESARGEHPLTMSAVPPVDWAELGMEPGELELCRYSDYGDPEILSGLGQPWGIGAEEILLASSTTHAHFCFAASILRPGDRVLHERPGYLPVLDALSMLDVEGIPFERPFEKGYALPRDAIEESVRRRGARLILVTHLHNPSGVALTEEESAYLAGLCEETGVEVLADEIYRPFLDPDPGPLHRHHGNIVTVQGLNKVHGLPLIRVGWGIATPERVEQARRVLDATTIHNSCLSDQVARFALGRLGELETRARRIAAAGWGVVGPWLARSPFEVVEPAAGLICFPRLPAGRFSDGDHLREALLEVGVGVTPGRFFGAPRHVRIGFGLPPTALREALPRINKLITPDPE